MLSIDFTRFAKASDITFHESSQVVLTLLSLCHHSIVANSLNFTHISSLNHKKASAALSTKNLTTSGSDVFQDTFKVS